MTKVRIDQRFKHKAKYNSVECDGPVMEADIDPMKIARGPAEEIAKVVERAIATNPAKAKSGRRRWVDTGHLATTMTAVPNAGGYDIVAPPDRLQREELLEQLIEDVPLILDPTSAPTVQVEISKSAQAIVKVR